MNWKTKELFEEALMSICDEGVFSVDQIKCLSKMLAHIAAAVDRESDCNKPSVTM